MQKLKDLFSWINRFILEMLMWLMDVLYFFGETDSRMLKNMRYNYDEEREFCFWEIAHAELLIFTQVEFNKAAQSLTEAVVPPAQKKSALGRLLKVLKLHFYNGFVCKIFSFVYVEFTCCIYRIMLHWLQFWKQNLVIMELMLLEKDSLFVWYVHI